MARNGPTSPAGTSPWLPVPFSLWPAEARLLLGMVALWCLLGLAVLGSASWWVAAREMGDATYYLKRQALWLIASWGLLYLGLRINLRRWLRLAAPALGAGSRRARRRLAPLARGTNAARDAMRARSHGPATRRAARRGSG